MAVRLSETVTTKESNENGSEETDYLCTVAGGTYSMNVTIKEGKYDTFELSFPKGHIKGYVIVYGDRENVDEDAGLYIKGIGE